MKLKWTDRYSGSDKPDEINRWGRVGYLEHISKDKFKMCQIAWIKKQGKIFMAYIYIGSGRFDKDFKTLEEAKKYCEEIINNFVNEYLTRP